MILGWEKKAVGGKGGGDGRRSRRNPGHTGLRGCGGGSG